MGEEFSWEKRFFPFYKEKKCKQVLPKWKGKLNNSNRFFCLYSRFGNACLPVQINWLTGQGCHPFFPVAPQASCCSSSASWNTPGYFPVIIHYMGLPRWLSGKESACQCRVRSCMGKSSWRRKWQPTAVFLPGKSHGQRSLVGYSPWSYKESDTSERLNSSIWD